MPAAASLSEQKIKPVGRICRAVRLWR